MVIIQDVFKYFKNLTSECVVIGEDYYSISNILSILSYYKKIKHLNSITPHQY